MLNKKRPHSISRRLSVFEAGTRSTSGLYAESMNGITANTCASPSSKNVCPRLTFIIWVLHSSASSRTSSYPYVSFFIIVVAVGHVSAAASASASASSLLIPGYCFFLHSSDISMPIAGLLYISMLVMKLSILTRVITSRPALDNESYAIWVVNDDTHCFPNRYISSIEKFEAL